MCYWFELFLMWEIWPMMGLLLSLQLFRNLNKQIIPTVFVKMDFMMEFVYFRFIHMKNWRLVILIYPRMWTGICWRYLKEVFYCWYEYFFNFVKNFPNNKVCHIMNMYSEICLIVPTVGICRYGIKPKTVIQSTYWHLVWNLCQNRQGFRFFWIKEMLIKKYIGNEN